MDEVVVDGWVKPRSFTQETRVQIQVYLLTVNLSLLIFFSYTVVQWLALSQKEGSGFKRPAGALLCGVCMSSRIFVGSLHILWLPPTVQRHAG